MGVGVRHTLFPGGTRLDALAFAGDVLPDATLRGMRMFRSHGGTVLTVAGPDLLSEVFAPSSDAPCRERHAGRGADTSAILLRVGTVTAGTAPAFGWSLALRYGSDLLPLRLLFAFAVWRRGLSRCPIEEVDEPCRTRSLRAVASPLRAFSADADRAFWRGRPAGKRGCVLVFTVAT